MQQAVVVGARARVRARVRVRVRIGHHAPYDSHATRLRDAGLLTTICLSIHLSIYPSGGRGAVRRPPPLHLPGWRRWHRQDGTRRGGGYP
eukprot:scaffold62296_cov44-Phaeocystis_antarctica.AAC.3